MRVSEDPGPHARDDAARRRRLAEVFGDVLRDTTGDERDDERGPSGRGGAEEAGGDRERGLQAQVPPHHG